MSKINFTREQLLFVVESILAAAVDEISNYTPLAMSLEQRKRIVHDGVPLYELSDYERGIVEQACMSLSALAAQLTGEDMATFEAGDLANDFPGKIAVWVDEAWINDGKNVLQRAADLRTTGRVDSNSKIYRHYPDVKRCALCFVGDAFDGYFAQRNNSVATSRQVVSLPNGGTLTLDLDTPAPSRDYSVTTDCGSRLHVVRLSNGQHIGLCEGAKELGIAHMDASRDAACVDAWICTIDASGVRVYSNSCDAPELLTRGLRSECVS